MNCAEAENLICDYAALSSNDRFELERHLAVCPACASLALDSAAALEFMGRAADVEPPQELLTRILFNPPWHYYRNTWWRKLFDPLLEPRFALGCALTVLSLFMLVPKARQLRPADLAPTQVWAGLEDRAYRVWARSVKFYDNLKFVYQIQATLRDWQQQSQETEPAADTGKAGAGPAPASNPGPTAPRDSTGRNGR